LVKIYNLIAAHLVLTLRIDVLSSDNVYEFIVLGLLLHSFDPSRRLVSCNLEGALQALQLGLLDGDELRLLSTLQLTENVDPLHRGHQLYVIHRERWLRCNLAPHSLLRIRGRHRWLILQVANASILLLLLQDVEDTWTSSSQHDVLGGLLE
jgi:hypothetical protein